MLLAGRIEWSRRFELAIASIAPGISASLVRLPFETTYGNRIEESLLWSGFVSVRFGHTLGQTVEVGLTAAAGVTVWTGLGDANPFTIAGPPPAKPPVLPTLGVGVDVRYFVKRNFFLLASPWLCIASIASDLLEPHPSRMTRIELLAGAGLAL